MTRELNRLTFAIICAFGVIAFGTAFWTVIERDNLRAREDNPRRVLSELNIQRGIIYDRHDEILAFSRSLPGGAGVERVYPHPEVVSAVGYYSYQYGQSGLEEGYNSLLSGDNLQTSWDKWRNDLLNLPLEGADIRSSLDLDLQLRLSAAMEGQYGGAIVVHVPSGEVLAMVSAPSYDPNQITLATGEQRTPLLNRVTAGRFQPGGTLQTLLLSEMLAMGVSLDSVVEVADVALVNPNLTLTCNLPTETQIISLVEAYRHGCPAPFVAALGSTVQTTAFEDKLRAAGLGETPILAGFALKMQPDALTVPTEDQASAAAAGQGQLTVNPLQMVEVTAALVNSGNGVALTLGEAVRYPNEDEWQPLAKPVEQPAILQPLIAQTIRETLEAESWSTDFSLYGHASRAYAGNRQYTWFLGWTPLQDGSYAVIVIVVESPQATGYEAVDIAAATLSDFSADTLEIKSSIAP